MSETKICRTCGLEKPIEAFGKTNRHDCGLCKYRRYKDRGYNKTTSGRKSVRKALRRYAEKNPEKRRAEKRNWQQKNRHKIAAQRATQKAVANGYICRYPCQVCGNEDSIAHHPHYERKYDVIWLCGHCHGWLHSGLLSLVSWIRTSANTCPVPAND